MHRAGLKNQQTAVRCSVRMLLGFRMAARWMASCRTSCSSWMAGMQGQAPWKAVTSSSVNCTGAMTGAVSQSDKRSQ
eukprot:1159711-Pelagomonas_calceolata.AAC.5